MGSGVALGMLELLLGGRGGDSPGLGKGGLKLRGDRSSGERCELGMGLLWPFAPSTAGVLSAGCKHHPKTLCRGAEQRLRALQWVTASVAPSRAVSLLAWPLWDRDRDWGFQQGAVARAHSSSFVSRQPYAVDGQISPQSNVEFDRSLRQR